MVVEGAPALPRPEPTMKSLLLLPVLFAAAALPFGAPRPLTAPVSGDQVVDTVHSSVQFRVRHADTAPFLGAFNEITGAISLDPKAPEKGSIAITIPLSSIDTRDAKRDEHLKGPDFFNAKENPDMTFKSTKIAKKDKMLEVTGDLAMAGKTKSITIPVEFVGSSESQMMGKRAGYSTTFTVKRSDFGMNYGVAQKALGDEVTLMIDLELTPKK